jgi:hypothetical protein
MTKGGAVAILDNTDEKDTKITPISTISFTVLVDKFVDI